VLVVSGRAGRNAGSRPVFVSTACLPQSAPLHRRLSVYGSFDLKRVELGARVSVTPEDVERVVGQVDRGWQFLVHNYFPPPPVPFVLNLASEDEATRWRSLDLIDRALALTSRLGATYYSVHGGFVTDPVSFGTTSFVFPPVRLGEASAAMDRFVATVTTALRSAERYGVQLLVENNVCSPELRGKVLFTTAQEFQDLFDAVPSPYLGMLLDTGHLHVSAATLGFDPEVFVSDVAPYVRAIHLHDNDGFSDTHRPADPRSPMMALLRRPEFAIVPLIVEAQFDGVADLREYVRGLREELT
jgi:sugar phosphate isomerase/epimerase